MNKRAEPFYTEYDEVDKLWGVWQSCSWRQEGDFLFDCASKKDAEDACFYLTALYKKVYPN